MLEPRLEGGEELATVQAKETAHTKVLGQDLAWHIRGTAKRHERLEGRGGGGKREEMRTGRRQGSDHVDSGGVWILF